MSKPLETRILDTYESLPRSEQQLADVVLEHQRELASYSATELARRAGVSKATAARLFKRLGYVNFNEARKQVRALRHWGSPLHTLEDLSDPEKVDPDLLIHLNNDIKNLTNTLQFVRPTDVARAVDALARSEKLWLIGLRNSYSLAHYARFLFGQLRSDIHLIPAGGLSFAEDVQFMEPEDVMLVIGFRRRPKILRTLMAKARERGLEIIYITDRSAAASARLADIVLRCHSRGSYLFDSYVAAVSLLNYLASALTFRLGEDGLARLKRVDELHGELDGLAPPGRNS